MEFRIADTFVDSLARLDGEEQKAVKTTAFDLQINPANPGMQFHRLGPSRDAPFWSGRVSSDLRLIVHRTPTSLMLCYVDHHDAAYRWAERRKIERHPQTGAAQLVEIRETVREILVPRYVDGVPVDKAAKPLFPDTPDWLFLSYGVPPEWLGGARAATEDNLFDLAEHLSPEAAEALEAPWEKWTIFLHPAQRRLVEREFSGPVRVSGSAGTGKTIVALHRAVHLARSDPEARVLLTTFSDTLANALRTRLRLLISNQPRIAERLEVQSITTIGRRLYEVHFGKSNIATEEQIREVISQVAASVPSHRFSAQFLWIEWSTVVDAWQLDSWETYRDVKRLGRKTRLAEKQRQVLWSIFEFVRARLNDQNLITQSTMFHRLAVRVAQLPRPTFDFAVVDESQDVSVGELRFLAALGGGRPNSLFFTGDLGQRIFQQPFSWKELGVDIRGRSSRLRINYRTSHQIRRQADLLLGSELSDVDGVVEERKGTISAFTGVPPTIVIANASGHERELVSNWISARSKEGLLPHEIAVFVRSPAELARARTAVDATGIPHITLDEKVETRYGCASITTMHLAKGLEFPCRGRHGV